MSNKIKKWVKAAGVRAAKTMAQTAVSMLTVGQAVVEVNWVNVISVSITAGIISVLTSVKGLPEIKESEE
ncbi:MAG: hypothetical protein HFG29_10355 [Eubacterium sp.]|nr:hypothetical protein [Eubacterium sp.]